MDPTIEKLKERGWQEVAAINLALAEGRISEAGWHMAMADLIRAAYLAANNPYAQAGHGGDTASWEDSRGFIVDAIDRSGTFLDAGCASGILMETVRLWAARKNLRIEPHGVEIVPELVTLARRRLPHYATRIHLGNVREWRPMGERFDFVAIRPEYAPVSRRGELAHHVLGQILKPGGRLIVFVGTEEREHRAVEKTFCEQGFPAHGSLEKRHAQDARVVRRIFWIDAKK